jgi:putative ABC transport system permease protein
MNFIKRAWLSLIAKKGRTLLLTLVTSAIMLFVLAGLLIHNAADTATKNAKASVGATLTLSANREAAFKKMQSSSSSKPKLNMASVKLSDAKQIAKLANVSSYNANVSTSVDADNFDTISTTSSSMGGGMPGGSSSSTGDISISGVTSTSASSNFEDGTYKITKGRGLTTADQGTQNVVIESELAKQDSLKVGDSIKVQKTSGKKTYTLKIVGIYKATSSSATTQMGPGASDLANTIYTSYTFANTVKGSKYANTADSVTFDISAPSKLKQVKKAGNQLINNSKYSLAANDTNYKMVKASMANIKSFADKIVWLVAIAGTIILALIVILMIRERRHEIGILLSMGEARWKIVGQFFTELLVVSVVAIGIAGIGGNFVGNQLGKQLMSQQTTSLTAGSSSQSQGGPSGSMGGGQPSSGGPTGKQAKSKTQDLDINVTLMTMVELGGFALAIMFLSTMIASAGVLRLEPKKVLIE